VCMILLEPVSLNSRNVAQAWTAGITYLEQGLTFLFHYVYKIDLSTSVSTGLKLLKVYYNFLSY